MLPRTGRLILGVIAVVFVILTGSPRAHSQEPDAIGPPAPAPAASPDVNIFLNSPASLEELLDRLRTPDYLLIKREEYLKRQGDARTTAVPQAPSGATVESVAVDGTVERDLAHLVVDFGVALAESKAVWVPIRLDEQNLIEAREGDRVLPVQSLTGKGWQIELTGKGRHAIRVRLSARLKTAAEGSRLELAIPLAPSTRFQLDVPERVVDAVAGANEPIEPRPVAGGTRTRLAQILTPRNRLDVSWRVEANEPRNQLAPLLSIQGEIAADIDSSSFRTRSSWMVYAVRGSARTLEFRLDPDDEILELELDGQKPPAGIEQVDGVNRLTINLSDPLQPGTPRKLVVATRRPLPGGPSARISFAGLPLANARAREQSGAIGIAKTSNLWVQPIAGRGIRQIDPRELPTDLRVRPATSLAYQFNDEPFELSLRVEPSPPLVTTNTRSRVVLSARQANVESRIDYQTARGGLFDISVAIPRGLTLESVGPPDVVESSKMIAETSDGVRVLNILLTPRARERSAFAIALAGRQSINPAKAVSVDLFQPRGMTSGGGRVAVVTDRSLTVEVPDALAAGSAADEFEPALSDLPSDWPWPSDRSPDRVVALWLRHDGNPASLPLRVTVHPRTVSHQTSVYARVERSGLAIQQETLCSVRFGSLSALEILVPPALQKQWELESAGELMSREDLGLVSSGDRLFRIRFGREITDRIRLKFRARTMRPEPLEADQPTDVTVPWIRIREGTADPIQVTLASDPSVELAESGTDWTRSTADESVTSKDDSTPAGLTLVHAELPDSELRIVATARPVVHVPSVVIPRLWIQTIQTPENRLRTTAWLAVETAEGFLTVSLPPGAEWTRARVGNASIQPLVHANGYRIPLPRTGAGGGGTQVVELEYAIPARFAAAPWAPIRPLDGALVQETLWEVRLPPTRSAVGVPPGWTDENRWFWDRYVWRRTPWKSAEELGAWVGLAADRSGRSQQDARIDERRYLFGRAGPVGDLRLTIASWGWLVAVCSGGVMILGGLLLLAVPSRFRLVASAIAALLIAVATASEPSVTILAIQSGAIGAIFVLLAAAIQRYLAHRRPTHSVFASQNRLVAGPASGSSFAREPGVGSDDSTAIRPRVASTVDHGVSAPVPASESPNDVASSSNLR